MTPERGTHTSSQGVRVPVVPDRALLAVGVSPVLFLTGCGPRKVDSAGAARALHDETRSHRVTCTPGKGEYSNWVYKRKLCPLTGSAVVLGINVSSTGIQQADSAVAVACASVPK
jgi:hypothetical protein